MAVKKQTLSPPLAEKMRPKTLDQVIGQEHLSGVDGILTESIHQHAPFSMILWGPPGCGKTTIATLYAKAFELSYVSLSAVSSGLADLKKIIQDRNENPLFDRTSFLIIDEIHRWNKAQQDFLLPYIEKGYFYLIGATTENPSLTINNALLSRVRVLTLKGLTEINLHKLLISYESLQGTTLPLEDNAKEFLIKLAAGDGRYLFNLIEALKPKKSDQLLSVDELKTLLQRRAALYDKAGEGHYSLISALHKAVRGSDPDSALYWLSRMLEGGEDPLYLARRMIRMATEDIGLADPDALKITLHAKEAYEALGSPEGDLALAECVIYLSLAPKSNAIYTAFSESKAVAKETAHFPPPLHIQNAPTKLMKELGYGKGYVYDHDTPDVFSGQHYFPDTLERMTFYHPKEIGFEREMKKRVDYFNKLREKLSS